MKYITGGLFIFFLLVLIYLLFRLWLEKRDNLWRISKLQFINNLNTNYVIIAWVPALALTASLLLLGLSWLPSIF